MTYKLHISGVITGSLNCFCLACDEFFKSSQDATHHIGTSGHQKKADSVPFSDKFPDEHIKKFEAGYYCEFCNVLMAIASKVNIHITEDEHKRNKGTLLLQPLGPDVVAFRNILIEEKAWHGLVEGVCSLCNAELDDESDHMTDAGHSLNMVLKPIQFGADNAIFRFLDDTAVQCLTCNKLLAPGRMSQHFDAVEHRELYAKRRIQTNGDCRATETKGNCPDKATNMTSVTEDDDEIKKAKVANDANEKNKREDKNNNEKSPSKDKSKILESIAKYQTKGININLETEKAFCKKCSEVVTFDFMEIEKHIENHSSATAVDSDLLYPSKLDQNLNRVDINDKTTQSDNQHNNGVVSDTLKALREHVHNDSSSKDDSDTNSTCSVDDFVNLPTEKFEKSSQEEEARDFAKANKITYNENNNQSYCRICEVHVPATFRSMKEHVAGANHKRLVTSTKPSPSQTKTPGKLSKQKTAEFIDSCYDIRGFFYIASMINEEYCILRNSLHLVSENILRIKCFVCDINLPPFSDVLDHVKTMGHQTRWQIVPVITSEKNEFIREVRPGLYHCGFCHLLVSDWVQMKLHLQCSDHQESRRNWLARLRLHLPHVRAHRMREQQMESLVMLRFFNMLRD